MKNENNKLILYTDDEKFFFSTGHIQNLPGGFEDFKAIKINQGDMNVHELKNFIEPYYEKQERINNPVNEQDLWDLIL